MSSFLLLSLPFSALLSSFLPSSSMSPADFSASVGTATLVLLPLSPLFDHLASYLLASVLACLLVGWLFLSCTASFIFCCQEVRIKEASIYSNSPHVTWGFVVTPLFIVMRTKCRCYGIGNCTVRRE